MAVITGGSKAADVLKTIGDKARGIVLKVGFFEGSEVYPDGMTVPEVAFDNEFGVPQHKQPPRPFFRNMIQAQSPKWGGQVAAAMQHGHDGKTALEVVGEVISGELVKSIVDFTTPGNAASTIARKGFDDPLVDTGQMQRSVTSKVEG